jgi:nitroreductase
MTSVTTALQTRISTRAFLDKPVSEETVRALLNLAKWSPSGGNLQPWKVIVVAGDARNAVVGAALPAIMANPKGEADAYPVYPPELGSPYNDRRIKVAEDMYAALGIPREDKPARLQWVARNFQFFGAPVGLFFVIDKGMGHGQFAHLGMFMQSLALAATEMGLATCMQEAWGMVRGTLGRHFDLPDNEMIYAGMSLGYADPDAPVNALRTDRCDPQEFAVLNGF